MKAWVPLASVVLALTFSGCQGTENRPEAGVSVQGCVLQSNGEYHLVDGFGHDYILSDPTSEVKQNVGHELLVRGNQVQNKRTPPGATGSQQRRRKPYYRDQREAGVGSVQRTRQFEHAAIGQEVGIRYSA